MYKYILSLIKFNISKYSGHNNSLHSGLHPNSQILYYVIWQG